MLTYESSLLIFNRFLVHRYWLVPHRVLCIGANFWPFVHQAGRFARPLAVQRGVLCPYRFWRGRLVGRMAAVFGAVAATVSDRAPHAGEKYMWPRRSQRRPLVLPLPFMRPGAGFQPWVLGCSASSILPALGPLGSTFARSAWLPTKNEWCTVLQPALRLWRCASGFRCSRWHLMARSCPLIERSHGFVGHPTWRSLPGGRGA